MNRLSLKKIKIKTEKSDLTKEKGITPIIIKVCQPGKNRNGFNISKDVLEKAVKKTMGLTPIIGLFDNRKEDFGDHGTQMKANDYGDYYHDEPRAVGVIPENFEMSYDDKGYLCVNGYLWTERYPEAKKALGKGQSMELNPKMTKFGKTKNGFTEILETGFLALTILGDNVEPCFEDAKIESGEEAMVFALDKIQDKLKKETEDLIKELSFSLNPQTDIMIDVDAEEKDKINREKITEAIDELEDILEDADEEDKEKIEEALRKLISAETDMKSEPKLVILDEEAKEALQGEPKGDEEIVEKENVNFAEDKKKKEQPPFIKEKTEKMEDGQEKVQETEKTGDKTETITEDKKTPAVKEGDKSVEPKDGVVEKSVEESQTEKSKGIQEGAEDVKVPEKKPASLDNTEQANEVAKQRADVSTMRLEEMLKGVPNTDVMKFLIDKLGQISELQTIGQTILGATMPMNNAPTEKIEETELDKADIPEPKEPEIEEKPVDSEPESIENREVDIDDNDSTVEDDDIIEKDEQPIEEKQIVEKDIPESEEEINEEKPDNQVVEEKEKVVEDPEEEKRKKAKSLNHSLMIENAELLKENKALKEQNKELLDFKLAIEKEQKEELLNKFSLSEETKEDIRKDFAQLSFSEIEDKAVLAQYHENKKEYQEQKENQDIVFSEKEEENLTFSINSDSSEDEIVNVLNQIREKNKAELDLNL